jgi:predicted metal-binding membrane protein
MTVLWGPMEPAGADVRVANDGARRPSGLAITAMLLLLAAVGWWWSVRSSSDMTAMGMPGMDAMDGMDAMSSMAAHHLMTFGGFLLMWFAMMVAMMFPAISPVVKLYSRAAAAGRVAPLPFFVAGYIAVWTSLAVPAYFAWRALAQPIADGETWVAYPAGGILVAAAIWQLTPLKTICLRHCRSPLSVFLRFGGDAAKPIGALRMGATHGGYCLGCCWGLMAILVALGTMNLAWMIGLAVLIYVEKNAPGGERIAQLVSVALVALGILLMIRPDTLTALT